MRIPEPPDSAFRVAAVPWDSHLDVFCDGECLGEAGQVMSVPYDTTLDKILEAVNKHRDEYHS